MNSLNIIPIIPEIFLVITTMGFLIAGVFQGNKASNVICWSTIISLAIAGILILNASWDTQYSMHGMLIIDEFSSISKLLILIGLAASLSLSVQYLYQERIARFEYPVLILFAGIGMMFMVSANNMLSMYMGLELQALSLYILTSFRRASLRSGEAGTKYFILGALSSGILLFGISLIYGYTGTLDFTKIADTLNGLEAMPPGFTIGMVFVLAALAFKISAAPFHMWTPDVYQGAPTSVTAFFAIVPKIAAIALLIRLLLGPFAAASDQWLQILHFICVASLLFGSFGGIQQQNIKRLFAYSSINNIGYLLIGIVAGSQLGISAVIMYLLIYIAMTTGCFAIILCMRKDGLAVENIKDLSGLSENHPVLAYSFATLLFAMSGLPPLAGFFGKLFIFNAAIANGHYALAILGVLASVIAAYYYLRIVKIMFFDKAGDSFDKEFGIGIKLMLLFSIIFTVGFIFMPTYIMAFADVAAASLF